MRITTVPISLKLLLKGQLTHFKKKNFDVLAVSDAGPQVVDHEIDGVPHEVVKMTRKITPLQDLISLFRLINVIRKFKPKIVHTHTPKAGLLGMVAAKVCGVPVRMHTVAGLPLMEKKGLVKYILIAVEKITYGCATTVYPNSKGLNDYITAKIGSGFPLKVIGKGSSNGIDTTFFSRSEGLEIEARRLREKHGITRDDIVYSFVGRVVRDKGISELLGAYEKCRNFLPGRNLFLLVVGPLEQDLDPVSPGDLQFLRNDKNVILAGYQSDVRPWIIASDIFVFPSYREGFPNVVLQACSLKTPCIVSDINGCNEIIEHNKTGLIVAPKDADALTRAMMALTENEALRKEFASAAMQKVLQDYDQRIFWHALEKEYEENLRLARINSSRKRIYRDFVKLFFDKAAALLALIVASPVMLICMALLALANRGKVWFTQVRPGKNRKLFKVIKFRTMSDERNESGELLPDKDRLHGIGKFIRKTSMDELPQLLNVVKGDMSIVGPRPLLAEYLPLYTEEQSRRHDVKPGITGWAQVNGRNSISWEQKFAYDVWYVDNQSFWLDLKILFLTVLKVFKSEGISSATSVTMEKFSGALPPRRDGAEARKESL